MHFEQNPIRLTYKSNPSAAAASMLTVPHPREEAAFASLCFLVMVVATTGLCVGPNLRLRVAMLPAYAIILRHQQDGSQTSCIVGA